MAAFCHGFLDDMDDKSLRADQGGLRADEQCEVRTPEPSLKKLRTLPTDDSLSSEPKHVNTSKAAIKPVSHGSLFKKAKPSNAAVAKSCAVALFQGAHTAPDKKRGKDTCPRADYGTQNTFAGRRPPKDPERRKAFDLMREDYAKLKVDAAKSSKKPRFPRATTGTTCQPLWGRQALARSRRSSKLQPKDIVHLWSCRTSSPVRVLCLWVQHIGPGSDASLRPVCCQWGHLEGQHVFNNTC